MRAGKQRAPLHPRAARLPTRISVAQCTIDCGLFRVRWLISSEVQVQSALLELVNPDGRCFELGRAGLRIDGIDREIVGRHLIVKM